MQNRDVVSDNQRFVTAPTVPNEDARKVPGICRNVREPFRELVRERHPRPGRRPFVFPRSKVEVRLYQQPAA